MTPGDISRKIIVDTIREEEDPQRRHWANLFVIELDNAVNRITKLEGDVEKIDDTMIANDHAHELLIRELQIKLSLIGAGSGGLSAVATQVLIFFLQNKGSG